jgi:hypothetical protein
MSPDALPPAATRSETDWNQVLSEQPIVSADLNPWRYGGPNPYIQHRQNMIRREVPVPHPNHPAYSSIETAKRRRKASDSEWWIRKQQQIHNERINHQTWIRPMSETAFQVFRPNIHTWHRVLDKKIPERFW